MYGCSRVGSVIEGNDRESLLEGVGFACGMEVGRGKEGSKRSEDSEHVAG